MRCKKCGMELADNAVICIACGTTVNDKEKSVESVEEKTLTPAAMNAQEQPPEPSPRGDKEKLFTAGLLTMIFLYVKDNDLDKDLNALKKAWNKGIHIWSVEQLKHLSEIKKGSKNPMYGKHFSKEIKLYQIYIRITI